MLRGAVAHADGRAFDSHPRSGSLLSFKSKPEESGNSGNGDGATAEEDAEAAKMETLQKEVSSFVEKYVTGTPPACALCAPSRCHVAPHLCTGTI